MNKKKTGSSGMVVKNTWFDYLNILFMIFFAFITLYPIYYVLIGSFNEGLDYTAGGVYFWPRKFTLDNYRVVLNDVRIWQGYLVTIGRTLLATTLHLLVTSMVAYAMSRRELRGKKIFYWINIITMFFGGGLIPYFIVIKYLGLFNDFLVYVIPAAYSVYNMIVIQNFFKTIPNEIKESATIDGANEYITFFKIMLPLSKPVLATVALWNIVGHWNSYFESMYYITNQKLYTLQYVLMRIINESTVPTGGIVPLPPDIFERISPKTVSLAAIMVSTIPVLLVYPFLQKYFTKGIVIGSLKG